MFQSEEFEEELHLYYSKHEDFSKLERIPIKIWAEHYKRPDTERNKSLNQIFDSEFLNMKNLYSVLEESQILGRTMQKFGIPNICGKINKKLLFKYRSNKSKNCGFGKFIKSKFTDPIIARKVKVNLNNKPSRYPPVAERWSDVALNKCRSNFLSKELNYKFYTYQDEQSEINLRDTSLKPRKVLGRILSQKQDCYKAETQNLDREKESDTLKNTNKIDKAKKSVRFNDDLCTFAPTQESFEDFPVVQESDIAIFQDTKISKSVINTNGPVTMKQISECLQKNNEPASANTPKTPAENRRHLEEANKDLFSLKEPIIHNSNNDNAEFEIEPYSEDKTTIDECSFSSLSDVSKHTNNKQESSTDLDAENNALVIKKKSIDINLQKNEAMYKMRNVDGVKVFNGIFKAIQNYKASKDHKSPIVESLHGNNLGELLQVNNFHSSEKIQIKKETINFKNNKNIFPEKVNQEDGSFDECILLGSPNSHKTMIKEEKTHNDQLIQSKLDSSLNRITINQKQEYSDDEYVPLSSPIQTAYINVGRRFEGRINGHTKRKLIERNSDVKQFEEDNKKQLHGDDCKVDNENDYNDYERTLDLSPGLSDRDYVSIDSENDIQIGDIHRNDIDNQTEETTTGRRNNNEIKDKIHNKLGMESIFVSSKRIDMIKSGDLFSEVRRDRLLLEAYKSDSENDTFHEIENFIAIRNKLDGDPQDYITPLTTLPSNNVINSQSPLWRHPINKSETGNKIGETACSKEFKNDINEQTLDNKLMQTQLKSSFERENINQENEYSDDEYVPLSSLLQTAYINIERPIQASKKKKRERNLYKNQSEDIIINQLTANDCEEYYNNDYDKTLPLLPGLSDCDYVSGSSEKDNQIEKDICRGETDKKIEETISSRETNNEIEEKIQDKLVLQSIFVSSKTISIMKNSDQASQLNKSHLIEEDKLNSHNPSFNETESLMKIKNQINSTNDLISPVIMKESAWTSKLDHNTNIFQVKKQIIDEIECSNEKNANGIQKYTCIEKLESTPCTNIISHKDDNVSIINAPSKNVINSQSPFLCDKLEIKLDESNQIQEEDGTNDLKVRRVLFLNPSYSSSGSANNIHYSNEKIKEQRLGSIKTMHGLKDSKNEKCPDLKNFPNFKRNYEKRSFSIDKEYGESIKLDFLEPCLSEKPKNSTNCCSTKEGNLINSFQDQKDSPISQILCVNYTDNQSSTTPSLNFPNAFNLSKTKEDLDGVHDSDSESMKPCMNTLKSVETTPSGKNILLSIQKQLSNIDTRPTLNNSDSDIIVSSNSVKLINKNMKLDISKNETFNEISEKKMDSASKVEEKEEKQCKTYYFKDEKKLPTNLESIPMIVAQTNRLKLAAPKHKPTIEIEIETEIDEDVSSLSRKSKVNEIQMSDIANSSVRVPDGYHIEYSLLSTGNTNNRIEATDDSQIKVLNHKRTALSISKITKKSTNQHIAIMESSGINCNQNGLKYSENMKQRQQSLDIISSSPPKCLNIGSEKPFIGSFLSTPPDSQVQFVTSDQRLAAPNWEQSLVHGEGEFGNINNIRSPFRAKVWIANKPHVDKNYPKLLKAKNNNIQIFTPKKSEKNIKIISSSTKLSTASTKKKKLRLSKHLGSKSVTNIKISGKQNSTLMNIGHNFVATKPQHSPNKAKHQINKKQTTAKYHTQIKGSGYVNEQIKTNQCSYNDQNSYIFSKGNKNIIKSLTSKESESEENNKNATSSKLNNVSTNQCAEELNKYLFCKSATNIKLGGNKSHVSIKSTGDNLSDSGTDNNLSNRRTQNSSIKANILRNKNLMVDKCPTQPKGKESILVETNDKIKIFPICTTNELEIKNDKHVLKNIQIKKNTCKGKQYDFNDLFSNIQITNSPPDYIRRFPVEKKQIEEQLEEIDTVKSANRSPSKPMSCTEDESSSQDSFFEKYSKRAFNTTESDTSTEYSQNDDLLINYDDINKSSETDNQSLSRYYLQTIKKRKKRNSSPLSNLFNEEDLSGKKMKNKNSKKNVSSFKYGYTVSDEVNHREEGEFVFNNGALNYSDYEVESPSENGEYRKKKHDNTSESTYEPKESAFPSVTDDAASLSSYTAFREDYDDLFDETSP